MCSVSTDLFFTGYGNLYNEEQLVMTLIREEDLVESIADAFQYISYFHPPDFVTSLSSAWEREESQSAKDAMAQILVNSRMAAMGRRPICQDTGSANVYLEVGYDVKFDFSRSLQEVVDEGVRRGYQFDKNPLRASIVLDPIGSRKNSGDNTPALLTVDLVPGNTVSVYVSAKGGGSENKAKFAVLNPSDSVADWVVDTVEKLGAGWCPPGILGIGVGGSSDRAMAMAKKALNDPLDMQALLKNGPQNKSEELIELQRQFGRESQELTHQLQISNQKLTESKQLEDHLKSEIKRLNESAKTKALEFNDLKEQLRNSKENHTNSTLRL